MKDILIKLKYVTLIYISQRLNRLIDYLMNVTGVNQSNGRMKMSAEQSIMGKTVVEYWQIVVTGIVVVISYIKMGGKVDVTASRMDDIITGQGKNEDKINNHDVRLGILESNITEIKDSSKEQARSVAKIFDLLRDK